MYQTMSYTTFKRVELENERKRQIEEQKAANPQPDQTPNSQDDTIDTTTTRDPQEKIQLSPQDQYSPTKVSIEEIEVINWFQHRKEGPSLLRVIVENKTNDSQKVKIRLSHDSIDG